MIPTDCVYLGDLADWKFTPNPEAAPDDSPQLCVGRCSCGYDFGIDLTFLDQVNDFTFSCPSCGKAINTSEVFAE